MSNYDYLDDKHEEERRKMRLNHASSALTFIRQNRNNIVSRNGVPDYIHDALRIIEDYQKATIFDNTNH